MVKIIVDIDVWNCTIRAFRPDDQQYLSCPNDEVGKMIWYQNVTGDRINKRKMGYLKGKAQKLAEKIVDENGAINTSGWYGSIEIDEKDFVVV